MRLIVVLTDCGFGLGGVYIWQTTEKHTNSKTETTEKQKQLKNRNNTHAQKQLRNRNNSVYSLQLTAAQEQQQEQQRRQQQQQ